MYGLVCFEDRTKRIPKSRYISQILLLLLLRLLLLLERFLVEPVSDIIYASTRGHILRYFSSFKYRRNQAYIYIYMHVASSQRMYNLSFLHHNNIVPTTTGGTSRVLA